MFSPLSDSAGGQDRIGQDNEAITGHNQKPRAAEHSDLLSSQTYVCMYVCVYVCVCVCVCVYVYVYVCKHWVFILLLLLFLFCYYLCS